MKGLRCTGYLAMFLPAALLMAGATAGLAWLLPIAYFVAFPLLRMVFGSQPEGEQSDWTASEVFILDWLPRIFVFGFAATMFWTLSQVALLAGSITTSGVGFMVSVLVMCGLASCVAHDLAHRESRWDRRGANLICALAGYPFFVFEHLDHHGHTRDTARAHCARLDESVWSYVTRRFLKAPGQAIAMSRTISKAGHASVLDGVAPYVSLSVVCWVAFAAAGGWFGAALYALLVVGVPFLLNTITYIQHWGLGDDNPHIPNEVRQIGWDDDCRFEAWMILGISFHEHHHRQPRLPYYRYGPTRGAPKLPAEYAIMVLICFVPSLWRRVMLPVIAAWQADPLALRSAGRGIYSRPVPR